MLRDLSLICELLKRGASTDIRVIANDFDGTPSSISGLTTYELPDYLNKKMNDPIYQKILQMFDDFKTTERCHI